MVQFGVESHIVSLTRLIIFLTSSGSEQHVELGESRHVFDIRPPFRRRATCHPSSVSDIYTNLQNQYIYINIYTVLTHT